MQGKAPVHKIKFSHVIVYDLLYLPIDEMPEAFVRFIHKRMSVANKYDYTDVTTHVYENRKGYYGIPLYGLGDYRLLSDNVVDKRINKYPVRFHMTTQLFPEQQVVMDRFKKNIAEGYTGAMVEAKPGWGKTVFLIAAAAAIGQRCLIVVHKSDLVRQWVQRFLDHTDLKKNEIATISGGRCTMNDKTKVAIGLVHTLGKERFRYLHNQFGFVGYDEVHASVPPGTFIPVVTMYAPMFRIGASATVKRKDNKHKTAELFLSETSLIGESSTERPNATIYKIMYDVSSGRVPNASNGLSAIQVRAKIQTALSNNSHRTEMIFRVALASLVSGRRVVIVADRTHILGTLAAMFEADGRFRYGFYCRSLSDNQGNTVRTVSDAEQEETAKHAQAILATSKCMAEGTDIPDIATVIQATPQSSILQVKGRAERPYPGKPHPVFCLIVDTSYKKAIDWVNSCLAECPESEVREYHYTRFMEG